MTEKQLADIEKRYLNIDTELMWHSLGPGTQVYSVDAGSVVSIRQDIRKLTKEIRRLVAEVDRLKREKGRP